MKSIPNLLHRLQLRDGGHARRASADPNDDARRSVDRRSLSTSPPEERRVGSGGVGVGVGGGGSCRPNRNAVSGTVFGAPVSATSTATSGRHRRSRIHWWVNADGEMGVGDVSSPDPGPGTRRRSDEAASGCLPRPVQMGSIFISSSSSNSDSSAAAAVSGTGSRSGGAAAAASASRSSASASASGPGSSADEEDDGDGDGPLDSAPVLRETGDADPSPVDCATSIERVKDCGWYWGPISSTMAEKILQDEPDGSFIVRDSSDHHYIFSLSFKFCSNIRHVRIDHDHGNFSFGSFSKFRSRTIVDFVENAVEHSRSGRYLFFWHRRAGQSPLRVQLVNPVSRFKRVPSLQHLCRYVIVRHLRKDLIAQLPLPGKLKEYLSCPHYYFEDLSPNPVREDVDEAEEPNGR